MTMSDEEEKKSFEIEKASNSRASCKKCKAKCEKGEVRIAKLLPNPWSPSDVMRHWYHINCLFEAFTTQKADTKRIESIEDVAGIETLTEEERDDLLEKIQNSMGNIVVKVKAGKKTTSPNAIAQQEDKKPSNAYVIKKNSADNLFSTFCIVCNKIGSESSYKAKSATLKDFLIKGKSRKNFEGDMLLWFKLLLPTANRRIYNLQSKQLVKIFSRVFNTDHQDMLTDLELGDVSETVRKFFESSKKVKPQDKSTITIHEVDEFLDLLSHTTKEDEQFKVFSDVSKNCDENDLKMLIRLIKSDLKINAGPRHILDGLHPEAYSSYQLSRDLKAVVENFRPLIGQINSTSPAKKDGKNNLGGVQVMTPISPMLADACKSLKTAIAKNPEGVYSEIKYDGERVQIHKSGDEFKFFSRSLKPVMDHKISRCKEFIPKAFPNAQDIILDSEIIVINTETGELLPFGTLGVHKREKFASSEICLFIFDCIYYNGEDLTTKPLKERRKILEEHIKPIKNHVQLSEYHLIKCEKDLSTMTAMVLKAGLEGLVLKSINGLYQPGKRGWLKLKKDYLFQGQMADTADLVVLGGWYGTGRKGGMLSIFLMGCYDERSKLWKTVTKVHSGLDDSTMEAVHEKLLKLTDRSDPDNPPSYLMCKKSLVPDLMAKDPMQMPVWEITGAEFTKSDAHTADGISIRFPRITRIRDDKTPKQATSLSELKKLFKASKDNVNIDLCMDTDSNVDIKTKFFLGTKVGPIPIKQEPDVKLEEKKSPKKRPTLNNASHIPDKKIKIEEQETRAKKTLLDGIKFYIMPKALKHVEGRMQQWNANVVKCSTKADIVLHHENSISKDIDSKQFNRRCRHLTYNWVLDSIQKEKLLPYPEYAVEIRNKL